MRLLILDALEAPKNSGIYVNATFQQARDIMWADATDGIPSVLELYGLREGPDHDYILNATRLEVVFRNGSRIELKGADRSAWRNLRGRHFSLLIVDECQKLADEGFTMALSQVIPDTLVAKGGRVVLLGTPDEFCVGAFHDICTGKSHWHHHHWTAEDLQHVTRIWAAQLAWKEETKTADDDPVWLREKRGLWVRQDDSLILPLTACSLWAGELPPMVPSKDGRPVNRSHPVTRYGGLDFGFARDPAAITILSCSPEEDVIREEYSEKRPGLNTQELADWINRVIKEHNVVRFYADGGGSGAQIIEDLRVLHRLPVTAADKHNKEVWIQQMRADLGVGKLQVLDGSELCEELRRLSPDPKAWAKRKISTRPGSDDHCYDAFRYVWRGIRTHHVQKPEPPMTPAERDEHLHKQEKDRRMSISPNSRNWGRDTKPKGRP